MSIIQPSKVSLNRCTINGIDYIDRSSATLNNNFHVKELRVFEDICKFYFTGQLVIETLQNAHEYILGPTVPVILEFEAPVSIQSGNKIYRQRFRIHSYESRPLSGGADGRMEHTIQLIGQEFYNDRHNTVIKGFPNITGTAAAAQIHAEYINASDSPGLTPVPSTGLIGSKEVPHQARNVKPVKAIHDILDRCVWAAYPSCAPVYFKSYNKFVMAPLQMLMETGSPKNTFYHNLTAGNNEYDIFYGYENVIHFRPLTPPGEANATSTSLVSAFGNAIQFFDPKTGQTQMIPGNISKMLSVPFMKKVPNLKARVQEMLAESNKSNIGSENMVRVINDLMQNRSIAKNGPGGYQLAQEAFLTLLTYTQKFWVSVPMQSGINITCGSRINIVHPIVEEGKEKLTQKTLFIPRLIHEIKFTQGPNRQKLAINGVTDMYCVNW